MKAVTKIKKSRRFTLVFTAEDQALLYQLAERRRTSGATVLRQLIWIEAQKEGLPASKIAAERP